ncbi:hypothetical protein H257_14740 [Aphanomyces astaci]|uniref:Uncharacterized protein n=1 Tax=Aphanomyces astaci TaxID=112090 RepID=W4FRN2_APHAT|nr:hypothetical protein H257_14740 [Aphanomyces astaci]ETV69601.1 hypothetical protein H257_14740 [Aphanomyces astaci]|eukprot:XP_009840928.1 hypothetical protein H257_14740 [Aphanomyces astaci]
MSDSITSLRQAAEWGMGSAVKVYRQLDLKLPYDPTLRGRRLQNIFLSFFPFIAQALMFIFPLLLSCVLHCLPFLGTLLHHHHK